MVAVFEVDGGVAGTEFGNLAQGSVMVVRMHKLQEGPPLEFLGMPAEQPGEGRVHPLNHAMRIGDADDVQSEIKEVIVLGVRPSPGCLLAEGLQLRGGRLGDWEGGNNHELGAGKNTLMEIIMTAKNPAGT